MYRGEQSPLTQSLDRRGAVLAGIRRADFTQSMKKNGKNSNTKKRKKKRSRKKRRT
jgi:hypothetical protein